MLDSLYKNTDYNFEIIIVNNGSTDGTEQYLNWFVNNFPRATVIHLPRNVGFSSGHNEAFKYIKEHNIKYDYICILNNDTLVGQGWLDSMIKCSLKDERIGIVGPVSNCAGGEQGYRIGIPFMELQEFNKFSDEWRRKMVGSMTREGVLVGLCMLFKKQCFEECLPFPDGFTMYEDNIVCLKALYKGWKMVVDRSTFIWHYGQKTFQSNQVDLGKKYQEMAEKFRKWWKEYEQKECFCNKEDWVKEYPKGNT